MEDRRLGFVGFWDVGMGVGCHVEWVSREGSWCFSIQATSCRMLVGICDIRLRIGSRASISTIY